MDAALDAALLAAVGVLLPELVLPYQQPYCSFLELHCLSQGCCWSWKTFGLLRASWRNKKSIGVRHVDIHFI